MHLYNSVGTTSIYEGHGVAPEVLQIYKAAWDAGDLTVRSHLVLSPTWRSLNEAQRDMATWAQVRRDSALAMTCCASVGCSFSCGEAAIWRGCARLNFLLPTGRDLPNPTTRYRVLSA